MHIHAHIGQGIWEYDDLGMVGIILQDIAEEKKIILYWASTCGMHNHNRTKLQVKGVAPHIMRRFAIAQLYKDGSNRDAAALKIAQKMPRIFDRVVGPAPQDVLTLYDCCDILFDFNAPHHKRGSGDKVKESVRLTDLRK